MWDAFIAPSRKILYNRKVEKYTYTIRIEPAEEGGYVASVPAVPGCHTQGETLAETISNIEEALIGFLEVIVERGERMPVERESKQPITFSIQVRAPLPA